MSTNKMSKLFSDLSESTVADPAASVINVRPRSVGSKRVLNCSINTETALKIRQLAARHNTPISVVVSSILTTYITRYEAQYGELKPTALTPIPEI